MLWFIAGVIVIAVVWALVAAYNGKPAVKQDYMPSVEPDKPVSDFDELSIPKATNWEEGAKASVSKRFGKGGIPTGVATDPGHMATKKVEDEDAWMKNARPFEQRRVNLSLEEDNEEIGEAV